MNTIPKDLLQKIIEAAEKRNVSPSEICRILRIPASVFVLSAYENEISLCDHYQGVLEDSINTKIEILHEILDDSSFKRFIENLSNIAKDIVNEKIIEHSQPVFFAWLDILGFKQIVQSKAVAELKQLIDTLLNTLEKVFDRARIVGDDRIDYSYDFNYRIHSDTVIVWTNSTHPRLHEFFLQSLCDTIRECLKKKILLRGFISLGDIFTVKRESNVFFSNEAIYGNALVQAYTKEGEYDWVGCVVSSEAIHAMKKSRNSSPLYRDFVERFFKDIPLLVYIDLPHKKAPEKGVALNWCYSSEKNSVCEEDIASAFGEMIDPESEIGKKYRNTLSFFKTATTVISNPRNASIPNEFGLTNPIMNRIIVTGGAGFIGSAVARHIINDTPDAVCVVDKLTYAGNLENLTPVAKSDRFKFEKVDICDRDELDRVFAEFKPTHVMHLAAESHVDRSIDGPGEFIQTNIVGTYTLLEAARKYFHTLDDEAKAKFKFHHISTDEVYGDLNGPEDFFRETTPYAPSSPYSASKASSDHLVRAWKRTFGLPTVVTNCSNNYGPYHFPEKLIPLVILHALDGKELPVYGEGLQIRDWLYVEDHARALYLVATQGVPGETYNIGGHNEKKNIEVVKTICALLDELRPRTDGKSYAEQIVHVKDRPGHDLRYAIDPSKIARELGWKPQETFESGIRKTVLWYLEHKDDWCAHVLSGSYKMERLGTGE